MKARMILMGLLIAVAAMLMSGCAASQMPGWMTKSWHKQPVVPESEVGTMHLFNHSQRYYAHCVLFRDTIPEERLFMINPETNGLMWANMPLGKLKDPIRPAVSREDPRKVRLGLKPNANYTIYILWATFDGRVAGESVVHFKNGLSPRQECRTGRFTRTCSSKIVDLPEISDVPKKFGIRKTLYIGDWIAALVGL